MQNRTIQLPASWLHHLEQEFQKPYIKDLKKKLQECKKKKITTRRRPNILVIIR